MPAVSSRLGLAALFPPLTAEQFRRAHWPYTTLHVDGDLDRLGGLIEPFANVAIAALFELPVSGLLAMEHRPEGAVRQFRIDRQHAAPLYETGYSIVLQRPALDPFAGWLRAIEADLGLPDGRASFDVLISPPGCAGTRAHWDPFELIEIQVRGRKRWTIAPNTDVASPPFRHITGVPPSQELAAIWPAGPRDAMPEGARTIDMRPGSVLFMPRGHWHATEGTEEASVHLVLYCPTPTWVEVVLPDIRRLLLARPEWRAPAAGAWSEDASAARERLDALLAALPDVLDDLDAGALLRARDYAARRRLVFPE